MNIQHLLRKEFIDLPAFSVLLADGLFLCAVFVIAKSLRRFAAIYMLFVLPGTCAHELAHFLAAIVTNGRPRLPSIIPARNGSGWRLGSVQLGNTRWYNAAIIALAPLLLVPLALWLYLHRIAMISLWHARHWIYLYIVIVMSTSALPSMVDWRLAWKYSSGLALSAVIAVIIYVIIKINITVG